MVTPDKPGGTPPKYGSGEKSRAKSAGYKLAGDVIPFKSPAMDVLSGKISDKEYLDIKAKEKTKSTLKRVLEIKDK